LESVGVLVGPTLADNDDAGLVEGTDFTV
jgi:hypothetical protein